MPKFTTGFTMIELLVVISIIGMLISALLGSLSAAKAEARNVRRLTDIREYRTALELFYVDKGYYPYPDDVLGNIVCLGDYSSNACNEGEDGPLYESNTVNNALLPYIPSLPTNTHPINFGNYILDGYTYRCSLETVNNNGCGRYIIEWYMEGENKNCLDGVRASGTGITICSIGQ